MKNVKAILHHRQSMDDKPKHEYCPNGEDSWCGFQRYVAMNTHEYKHLNPQLPKAVVKEIKPVFYRLSDQNCVEGYMQNAAESGHIVLWTRCPKKTFVGNTSLRAGLNLGIVTYNNKAPEYFIDMSH